MDDILQLVSFLRHWRFTLSVIASTALAFVLSIAFVEFTAGYCVTLVLCGTAYGLIWHGRGELRRGHGEPAHETRISHPVAFMGFALVGFIWGGIAHFFLRSELLAALSLIFAVTGIGLWYRWGLKPAVSLGYLAFAAVSLLLGYGFILLLNFANS